MIQHENRNDGKIVVRQDGLEVARIEKGFVVNGKGFRSLPEAIAYVECDVLGLESAYAQYR